VSPFEGGGAMMISGHGLYFRFMIEIFMFLTAQPGFLLLFFSAWRLSRRLNINLNNRGPGPAMQLLLSNC